MGSTNKRATSSAAGGLVDRLHVRVFHKKSISALARQCQLCPGGNVDYRWVILLPLAVWVSALKFVLDHEIAEQRAHLHDDPERRALTQPCHGVVARARSACPTRLAHHAGAGNTPNVGHAVVAHEFVFDKLRAEGGDARNRSENEVQLQ